MSGVEAAASLFGSDDSGSDPFASLGNGTSPPAAADTTPQQDSVDLFGGHGTSVPDFLQPSPENGSSVETQYTTWPETTIQELDHSTGPSFQDLGTGGPSYDQTQGWYDEYGQWHDSVQSVAPSVAAVETPAAVAAVNQPASSVSYDPYAPQSSYSVPSSASTYAQPAYTPSNYSVPSTTSAYAQPAYTPQVPIPDPPNPYAPAPAATASYQAAYHSPSTYNVPPTTQVGSQYNAPYAPSTYSAYATQSTPLAPVVPPAPPKPITRPKVSNAYDPPFPTTKSTRRVVSQYATPQHNSYTTVSPPPLPPPPAKRPFTPPSRPQTTSRPPSRNPTHVANGAPDFTSFGQALHHNGSADAYAGHASYPDTAGMSNTAHDGYFSGHTDPRPHVEGLPSQSYSYSTEVQPPSSPKHSHTEPHVYSHESFTSDAEPQGFPAYHSPPGTGYSGELASAEDGVGSGASYDEPVSSASPYSAVPPSNASTGNDVSPIAPSDNEVAAEYTNSSATTSSSPPSSQSPTDAEGGWKPDYGVEKTETVWPEVNPYPPMSGTSSNSHASPPPNNDNRTSSPASIRSLPSAQYSSYAPKSGSSIRSHGTPPPTNPVNRTSSPASVHSLYGVQNTPYAPVGDSYSPYAPMSGSSIRSHGTPPPTNPANRTSSPASVHPQAGVQNTAYAGVGDSYSPYAPMSGSSIRSHGTPPPTNPVNRTSSPTSLHSLPGVQTTPYTGADSYAPRSYGSEKGTSAPYSSVPLDPYAPKVKPNGYIPDGSTATNPSTGLNGLHNATPYAPPQQYHQYPPRIDPNRNRSMSNGSTFSASSGVEDPYAPLQHSRLPSTENDFGSYTSRYDYPNNEVSPYSAGHLGPPQEIAVKPQTHAPYVPSPSLMGTNDPLGRTAARIPVFSFGFGGKLVTCFHGASTMSTGFDVALSSRNSTGVHIRVVNKIVPPSALDVSTSVFPGPLFSDPGTASTVSLVRTGASAQTKTKKAAVLKYISEREEEISQGLGYLHTGSQEKRDADGKLVLFKLLKVMVDHDGRLSGTPKIDADVRAALVPRLDQQVNGQSPEASASTLGFSSVADIHGADSSYSGFSGSPPQPNETPIAVSTLRPSAVEKIQDLLLRGERRQAYHYALDERLWAHAMVIASGIDKEAWKEVVNEFLKTELGPTDDSARGTGLRVPKAEKPSVNGREGLRVAYSLFSGQGAAAVQELVPQSLLSMANGRVPMITQSTPMTPNFAAPAAFAGSVPEESLAQWSETAAMMISNSISPETSSALTALGDQLFANKWVGAAHACYLLAPQTSPVGGLGHPSARIILVGSQSPQTWPSFAKDPDAIILSEILEFAQSLVTPAKGQDAYSGLPHLQAYRFIRAMTLAELGDVPLATRYCDAITKSLGRGSPYFTGVLLNQLKDLQDRITGVSLLDKSGSWIGGKLTKPSLDTIGGWLEGRFTKLVTGDAESDTPPEDGAVKKDEHTFNSTFSHYSTISSTTTSASPSPQPSVINRNTLPPPGRTGSAMSTSSSLYTPHTQIDRASSAMDYQRRRPSPAPRIASAGPATTTFGQSMSFGQAFSERAPYAASNDMMTPRPSLETTEEDEGQEVWWGGSYGASTETPTTATFMKPASSGLPPSSEGFVSLMDSTPSPFATTPESTYKNQTQRPTHDEDEDDLGFGNSKPKEKPQEGDSPKAGETPKAAPQRPEINPAAASGSWISRWWKKGDAAPGPIKASLGEETTFYFDPELKRWVNKKAGAEATAKPATPPPPPARAQTASPGMTGGHRPPPPAGHSAPPPARSASAIDLSTSPPQNKTVMRVRSNLVPTPEAESAPSTPTGTRLAPPGPPPGRPKSQASKRNIRSRYVDVFHEGDAA